MKRNERGFWIYTSFRDTYGAEVSVTHSSAAGVRRCWIGARGGGTLGARQRLLSEEPKTQPGWSIVNDNTSGHLTPAMARRLAKALLRFADGGTTKRKRRKL